MKKRLAVCGLLGLALLAGCGAESTAAAPESGAKDKRHERETLIADCMKQKGFKYVIHVPPFKQSDLEKRVASGDYASLKEVRSKYGFGAFSRFVYKDEGGEPERKDPNEAIKAGLDKGQLEAYELQAKTCYTTAVKKVFGFEVKSLADFSDLTAKEIERVDRELNGDAKLNELAGPFAQCLTGKGEKVSSSKPLDLAARGSQEWEELVAKQKEPSAAAARPYLTREIKSALTDLECGKEFYAAFNPLSTRLNSEARVKFGFLPQS
ncbi:hypothetical protein [Nonomuraea endophytica]|uniref:Lipoprotein n=1 Tax=Nonomuraea endophytica TaxID=714136 RepID=A0A7W8ELW2_9ACTN|nr:hypothetical protein [Nonomuraea endophytica]MBB5083322.1 hypothetical protein [Nonomuraea endophytica]